MCGKTFLFHWFLSGYSISGMGFFLPSGRMICTHSQSWGHCANMVILQKNGHPYATSSRSCHKVHLNWVCWRSRVWEVSPQLLQLILIQLNKQLERWYRGEISYSENDGLSIVNNVQPMHFRRTNVLFGWAGLNKWFQRKCKEKEWRTKWSRPRKNREWCYSRDFMIVMMIWLL